MLTEALRDPEGQNTFSDSLERWFAEIQENRIDLQGWDRTAMWQRLRSVNPRLRPRTLEFADLWYELVMAMADPPSGPTGTAGARQIVRERERTLKGMRARLTYAEARDNRRGYPASGRLQFRWPQVQRIVADILEPLESS